MEGDPGAEPDVRRSNSMIRRDTAESDLFMDLRLASPGDVDVVVEAAADEVGAPEWERGDGDRVDSPSPPHPSSAEAVGAPARKEAEGTGASSGKGLELARRLSRSEAIAATAGADA